MAGSSICRVLAFTAIKCASALYVARTRVTTNLSLSDLVAAQHERYMKLYRESDDAPFNSGP